METLKSIALLLAVLFFFQAQDISHQAQAVYLWDALDSLLEERHESHDPARKLKPGEIILPCSSYPHGCCPDHKTPADGPQNQGCGPKLCIDEQVYYCRKRKEAGRLQCNTGQIDESRCAFSCNRICQKPASKLNICRRQNHPNGCCWDGTPALRPRGRGCIACFDRSPWTCKQFKSVSGGCNSPSYGIRRFMETRCPETCDICKFNYT